MARKRTRKNLDADVDEAKGDSKKIADVADVRPAQQAEGNERRPEAAGDRRSGMADIARRRAAHFAHFKDDDGDDQDTVQVGANAARTLGPWSSAMELVNNREKAVLAREEKLKAAKASLEEDGKEIRAMLASHRVADPFNLREGTAMALHAGTELEWQPSRDVSLGPRAVCSVQPLFDMCLDLLTEYIDCVESLWGVPDAIKVRLAASVCLKRKMSPDMAKLFCTAAPGDVVLLDCTQLEQPAMNDLLTECVTSKLERLELHFCGRGFGDVQAARLQKLGPLPKLESCILGGAYRLSDEGLEKVLAVAPNLVMLSLNQGSRLTGTGIAHLPALVPKLRHLNLQDCRGVGADALCSSIPQLMALQTLNLDGIQEVDDAVVAAVARSPQLRDLSICYCQAVTDTGLSTLAAARPELEGLRMDECTKVTDRGIEAVAGNCKNLKVLSARRCQRLSDEALSLLASRGMLQQLLVSGVPNVGVKTMKALALCCKDSLEELDISFCRHVPDKALGLVADRCCRLRRLLLFGCSQVSKQFLYGHSNDHLTEVLGLAVSATS